MNVQSAPAACASKFLLFTFPAFVRAHAHFRAGSGTAVEKVAKPKGLRLGSSEWMPGAGVLLFKSAGGRGGEGIRTFDHGRQHTDLWQPPWGGSQRSLIVMTRAVAASAHTNP